MYCPDPWEVRGDGRAARGDDRQGGGGREGGRRAGGHPGPRQTAPGHHGVRVGLRGAPRTLPRHRLQAEGRLIQILTYMIQGRIQEFSKGGAPYRPNFPRPQLWGASFTVKISQFGPNCLICPCLNTCDLVSGWGALAGISVDIT